MLQNVGDLFLSVLLAAVPHVGAAEKPLVDEQILGEEGRCQMLGLRGVGPW